MLWTRKQSKKSFCGLIPCGIFAIPRASCFACVLASLLPCFFPVAANADDTNFVFRSLSVEDLTQEQFDSFSALAPVVLAASSTGNITNDVAAILELLLNASNRNSSTWRFKTEVDLIAGLNATRFFNLLFSERANEGQPTQAQSYLYEIQRALYGSSGVPSQHDSVISTLLRVEQKPVSTWTTNDILRLLSAVNLARSPWTTNDVESLVGDVSHFLSWFNSGLQGWSDSNSSLALSVKDYDLVNLFEYVYKTLDSDGDDSVRVHDEDLYQILYHIQGDIGNDIENYLRSIIEEIEQSGADISGNLHDTFGGMSNIVNLASIEDYLSVLVPSVTNSEEYARLIHEVDLGYQEGSSRSVQQDFRFLQQQIGVEYPTASNSIAGILGRLFYSPEDAIHLVNASNALSRGEVSGILATNVMASSERDVASVLRTNELDWAANEYSSTSPYSEIANLGSSAGSQFANALPDLPDATDRTLVLFRGNFPIFGGSQSRRAGSSVPASTVNLDVSYPLADFDAVSTGFSTMNGIMSTIWDVIGVILIAWMYKRFYDDVSSGRFEGSMG